jgi:hypothetical protein
MNDPKLRGSVPFLFLLLLTASLWSGCGNLPREPDRSQSPVVALQKELLNLDTSILADDAARFAQAAVNQSAALGRQYHAVSPSWLHNILVNSGLRPRGLCYEWTNDLFPILHELDCQSLQLHLAVARMDTKHEHNCVVVTARNQPFAQGIVIDGWRRSGRLWFGRVATDEKHPWRPLPPDRVAPELKKFMPQTPTAP